MGIRRWRHQRSELHLPPPYRSGPLASLPQGVSMEPHPPVLLHCCGFTSGLLAQHLWRDRLPHTESFIATSPPLAPATHPGPRPIFQSCSIVGNLPPRNSAQAGLRMHFACSLHTSLVLHRVGILRWSRWHPRSRPSTTAAGPQECFGVAARGDQGLTRSWAQSLCCNSASATMGRGATDKGNSNSDPLGNTREKLAP